MHVCVVCRVAARKSLFGNEMSTNIIKIFALKNNTLFVHLMQSILAHRAMRYSVKSSLIF